ncbi:hypothetical protein Q6A68_04220, partial [Helicobacter pylori]|nr:hypothetical protein [Helicobacter pylori]
LHAYLLVVLIGTFINSKALERKRYASLFFHSSLIFIILGAAIFDCGHFKEILHASRRRSLFFNRHR